MNVIYNFFYQQLTYKSVGDYLADNLGPSGELHHKRVCILEEVYKKTA